MVVQTHYDLFNTDYVGSFVLDMGDYLRSASDVIDNDEYNKWQGNVVLLVIYTYIFV